MAKIYYCTCDQGRNIDGEHLCKTVTQVDLEGVCVYCGFYAVEASKFSGFKALKAEEAYVVHADVKALEL